jgi:photosystem II stability/assembly factor-like uncharacterized protein
MGSTAILSPNGQPTTNGEGPAVRMFVATLKGMVTLERKTPDADWAATGHSLAGQHVSSLLREPASGKLFAGAHGQGGVWVSDDGAGASWRRVATGLTSANVYSLAGRRIGDAVTIFAGVEPAALFRSDDLGETWRELPALRNVPGTEKWTFPPPPHIAHVKCITIDAARPTTLYACIEQGALLKSEDDGESWIELDGYVRPDDATYRDTHRMEIHPANRDLLYLTTGLGLNRSEDAGRTWTALTRRGARLGYPDFVTFDPRNRDIVLMAGAAKPPGDWMSERSANPAVLKSTDGGGTWRELVNGLPQPIVGSIEAMTRHDWGGGSTLAIATATGEIYTSDDGGERWTEIAAGLPPISKSGHYRAFMPPGTQKREGLAAFAD